MPYRAFIGVGCNTGACETTIARALFQLEQVAVGGVRCASLYRTAPLHRADQPEYLNTVVEIRTVMTPSALLHALQSIETQAHRRRDVEIRFGPRTLDLDILLYDEFVINATHLRVPHPRMTLRAFVLVPLLELWPNAQDPADGHRYSEDASALAAQRIQRVAAPNR